MPEKRHRSVRGAEAPFRWRVSRLHEIGAAISPTYGKADDEVQPRARISPSNSLRAADQLLFNLKEPSRVGREMYKSIKAPSTNVPKLLMK
jgi:hypothetical protein